MECRGTEKRQQIVRDYNVVPVAHIQLLAGQTKHSDAGQTIENDYYIFEATSKKSGSKEIIQCGMTAANDFLRLLNHDGLPIFNPLHTGSEGKGPGGNNPEPGGTGGVQGPTWNPVAKQLYNAIMWLIIAWDASPDTPLFEFRREVIEYKSYKPFPGKVKRVNSVIKNGGKGKTLTQIIDEFRAKNDVRDELCKFDLLEEVINNYTDRDGNPISLQSMF